MADIGRINISKGLKRSLELTGSFQPSLGEGIVPTIQLEDLSQSPFSLSDPWWNSFELAGVAAQYSYIAIRGTLLEKSWLSIDQLVIDFLAAGDVLRILPYAVANLPAGLTALSCFSQRQIDNSVIVKTMGEVSTVFGNSATAPAGRGLIVRGVANTTLVLPMRFTLNQNGALVIVSAALNQSIEVSVSGRLHMTSAV